MERNAEQDADTDKYSHIVSGVIHEYDVIENEADQDDNDFPTNQQQSNEGNSNGNHAPAQISSRHRLSSSERSNTLTEEKIETVSCPKINCPEKIIFCIDASVEMEKMSFRSRAG
ncbi:uncharacterized protein LOC132712840 [Ruditapes philippinarum]|uniref:uncharacterized protein LOC132712840 n=1 Tax=Ruditapes philippinarum TaxID=129788 RepID=UPI00295BE1AE|nr:uncharacterized protein LOC132712840 [Ruditapes philippinarum]